MSRPRLRSSLGRKKQNLLDETPCGEAGDLASLATLSNLTRCDSFYSDGVLPDNSVYLGRLGLAGRRMIRAGLARENQPARAGLNAAAWLAVALSGSFDYLQQHFGGATAADHFSAGEPRQA